MKKQTNNFLSNEHGGVMILFAFALVTLIIAMGISIEMGRIFLLRTKAFNALDTATLAAAAIATNGISQKELSDRAEPFFNSNFPAGYLGATIKDGGNLKMKYANGKVTGNITMNMGLFFGNFLPFDNIDLPVTTQVSRRTQNVEIALALDHTTSMCIPGGGCGSGSLFAGLRHAVDLLFQTLNGPESGLTSDRIFYSYIPFVHTVRMDGKLEYAANTNIDGLEESLAYLPSIRGLSSTNADAILKDMEIAGDAMLSGGQGGTNTAIGTYWAWKSLRPQNRDEFEGDDEHKPAEGHPMPMVYQTTGDDDTPKFDPNNPTYKYLMILTDGINQYFYNGKPYTDILADADQINFCTLAKQEGIIIYTIGYGNNITGRVRKNLFTCASDDAGEEGNSDKSDHFFLAVNEEALIEAFKKIAFAISSLVISQ